VPPWFAAVFVLVLALAFVHVCVRIDHNLHHALGSGVSDDP